MVGMTALDMGKTVLGMSEGKDRAALMDYMRTGGQNIDPATRAWCAAFINASLEKAGYSGTGSDLARSFMNWGNAVAANDIQAGDIGVFPRGNDPTYGHAGIVESYDPATGTGRMLAGNVGAQGQGAVAEQEFTAKQALGFRRAQAVAAAGGSEAQIKAAFLDTIAGTESPGYDVLYGGGKFTDYSRHPGQDIPITSGPNAGKTSSAAGRYQFLKPTWESLQKQYGYKDFSPENQDAAAWQYAQDVYKQNTGGGSLAEALQSGDKGRINAAAEVLNKTWTSLPGGPEQAKGYGTQTFYDVYSGKLKKPQQGPPMPAKDQPAVAAKTDTGNQDKYAKAAEGLFGGLGGFAGAGQTAQFKPIAAPTQTQTGGEVMPMVAETPIDAARRDQLARLMQSYGIV